MKKMYAAVLLWGAIATAGLAAEIKVLSAGAVEPGLRAFAQLTKRETGNDLKIEFNTAPQIARRCWPPIRWSTTRHRPVSISTSYSAKWAYSSS